MSSKVELSDYEKLIYNVTSLGDFNVIGIAILDGQNVNLDIKIVKKALFYMYNRHPLLRARLQKDEITKKVYFNFPTAEEKLKDEENIQVVICELEEQDKLTDELEAFNSIIFNYGECLLWRVKLIKYRHFNNYRYALALVLPFFITDGMNINALCIEIVNILNSLLTSSTCIEMNGQLELIDNLHQLINNNMLLNREGIESRLKYNKNVVFNLPGKFKTIFDNGVKINLMPLETELSKSVIETAKSRSMKLTGFLFAAAFYALKQLYEDNNFHFPRDVSCGIPANLRIRLDPNIDFSHIRNCVLMTHLDLFYPRITFQDIWKDAQYINEVVSENTRFDNGSILELSHDDEYLDLGNTAFETLQDHNLLSFALNSHKNFDLSLSNLGTYLYDRKKCVDGPLKLSEIYHGDSINSDPNSFCSLMLHISTWDGRIMIQLSSSRKAIAAHYSDKFMHLYQLVIEKSIIDAKIL
jgi:hypothetical protein